MTGDFKDKTGTQSRLGAFSVKKVLTAPNLLSPDFGQCVALFRCLEMLPVEIDISASFCIHNRVRFEFQGRLAIVVIV
jgi:hypothetical protein